MALDLEVIGAVAEIREAETRPRTTVKRLRDSHHALAKCLARGLTPLQASLQTGYCPSRIAVLQADTAFQELLAFYREDADRVAESVEAKMALVGFDAMQAIHERILDDAEAMSVGTLTEVAKTFLDRAGYSPVSRSVNKNLNVNIGDRLDAARQRRG